MATAAYEQPIKPLRVPNPYEGGGTLLPPPTSSPIGPDLGAPTKTLRPPAPTTLPVALPPPTMAEELLPDLYPGDATNPGVFNPGPMPADGGGVATTDQGGDTGFTEGGGPVTNPKTGAPITDPYGITPIPPPAPTMWDDMMGGFQPAQAPTQGQVPTVNPYASLPTYQPTQMPTPPQVDLQPFIQQIMGQFAGGPGVIDSELFQGLWNTGNQRLDESYGAQQRQLEGNLASRGLDFSSTAGGALSDLATQRGRAGQEMMQSLMLNEWNNMANLRQQGVQGMTAAAGLQQGEAGQNWQSALQGLQAGMAQQGQQYGQQTGERGYQDYLNQQARQQGVDQYGMQNQAWQQGQQEYQNWVNSLTAAGIDTTAMGLGAWGQGAGTALTGAQMYSDEIQQYAQSLAMMFMFMPQMFQAL